MTCGYPWRATIGSDHECKLPDNHGGVHACVCGYTHDGVNARDQWGKYVRGADSRSNGPAYMEAIQDVYDRMRDYLIEVTIEGGEVMSREDAVGLVDKQLEGFVLFPNGEASVAS